MANPAERLSFYHAMQDYAQNQADKLAIVLQGETTNRSLTFAQLHRAAKKVAKHLEKWRGDRVVLYFSPGLNFSIGLLGCLYSGVTPIIGTAPEGYDKRISLEQALREANCKRVLSTQKFVAELKDVDSIFLEDIKSEDVSNWNPRELNPEDKAYICQTAAATDATKGVIISQGNLLWSLKAISTHFGEAKFSNGCCTWLPPQHHLGLFFGILFPLFNGVTSWILPTEGIIANPFRWLKLLCDQKISFSLANSHLLEACLEKVSRENLRKLDLSTVRVLINADETISPPIQDAFADKFWPVGLRPETIVPAYGLSEATAFVTIKHMQGVLRKLSVDNKKLEQGEIEIVPIGQAASHLLVSTGMPLPGVEIFIVDPKGNACLPPHHIGEIWARGPGIAAEYCLATQLTERFLRAAVPGEQPSKGNCLVTGDLGCIDERGELFVTGRARELITIRGRSIYPADLENSLRGLHPALIPHGVAIFSTPGPTDERLIIGHEINNDIGLDYNAIQHAIVEHITNNYGLVVNEIHLLPPKTLSRSESGNILRPACKLDFQHEKWHSISHWTLKEEYKRQQDKEDEAIQNTEAIERFSKWLVNLLAKRLHRAPENIDVQQHIASFGIDSLASIELTEEIHNEFNLKLEPVTLWQAASIQALAHQLFTYKSRGMRRVFPPVAAQAEADRKYVTMTEEALLNQLQSQPNNSTLKYKLALNLRGDLDVQRMVDSISALIIRHEAMRTGFVKTDNKYTRKIAPQLNYELMLYDFSSQTSEEHETNFKGLLQELENQVFPLADGPLFSINLIKSNTNDYVMVMMMSRLICDHWSINNLLAELFLIYNALGKGVRPKLQTIEAQLSDFSAWEHVLFAEDFYERQRIYWGTELGALKEIPLPFDGDDVAQPGMDCDLITFHINGEFNGKMREMTKACAVSPFIAYISAFQILLFNISRQTEIAFKSEIVNRQQPALKNTIGNIANGLFIRETLHPRTNLGDLLHANRDKLVLYYAHCDLPYAYVIEQNNPGHKMNMPNANLVYRTVPRELNMDGITVTLLPTTFKEKQMQNEGIHLDLELIDDGKGITGYFYYRKHLFKQETIEKYAAKYQRILQGFDGNLNLPISTLLDA